MELGHLTSHQKVVEDFDGVRSLLRGGAEEEFSESRPVDVILIEVRTLKK